MILKKECIVCYKSFEFTLTEEQNNRLKAGEKIQRVFPRMKADERELFISNICGKCFDKMLPDPEEE